MVRLAALVHFKTNTSPLKKIAHVSLHITKKHRHFGLSSPVSFSFPARWQVVAPPRRKPKPPPFSKINTYLSILFHIEHKSRLMIFKMQAQKPRSTIKFEKKEAKSYLRYSRPRLRFAAGKWTTAASSFFTVPIFLSSTRIRTQLLLRFFFLSWSSGAALEFFEFVLSWCVRVCLVLWRFVNDSVCLDQQRCGFVCSHDVLNLHRLVIVY